MRKCPVCTVDLIEIDFHGQVVDRCNSCQGIYFDHGELESIIHLVELFCKIDLQEQEIDTIEENEKNKQLCCPADGQVMKKREVAGEIIDICPQCQRIWLDNGELLALKSAEKHIKQNLNLYIRLGS